MLRQEILGMLQDAPATGFQFEHSKDFRIERNNGLQLAMFANRGHPLAGELLLTGEGPYNEGTTLTLIVLLGEMATDF